VGEHWGGTLYMGQVVTGGRLEVTALGDEVNECARIEQTAAGGALLASKALVERLSAADAAAIGVDPPNMAYRALADLDGADAKAIRDAGLIAVAPVGAPLAS
jgi:class 3 adenylate cyclase